MVGKLGNMMLTCSVESYGSKEGNGNGGRYKQGSYCK